jgi:putative PIN family toxin of toxin-antitoxin system
MAVKKIRVILDTNWYISATINRRSRRLLYQLLTNNNIVILFSDEILKSTSVLLAAINLKISLAPNKSPGL